MSTSYDPLGTDEAGQFIDSPRDAPPKRQNKVQRYVSIGIGFLGFKKWYNFLFFFILGGALFFFCWYNIKSVDVEGYWLKHTQPGEFFYFRRRRYSIGMQIHLGCILPGGILATLQFVPIIRHKLIWAHRINGWLVTLLLTTSNAGIIMILNRSLGGGYDVQVFGGILFLFTTISAWMGIVNIKLKQIDQHRKWMMRTWVYAASIITLRFVQMASVHVISRIGGFYMRMRCDQLAFVNGGDDAAYPQCAAGGAETAVRADFLHPTDGAEATAPWQLVFGQAGLIAFTIHAVLVEVYFHLTPAESERLRMAAYERQLDRGYKHPGSGGLTSDRLGDAPRWRPARVAAKASE